VWAPGEGEGEGEDRRAGVEREARRDMEPTGFVVSTK
jgi:hypothetical protein